MKNILMHLIFFLFGVPLPAQPIIEWQKTLGGSDYDEATCIQVTTDSGYIVTGRVLSTDGDVLENLGLFDFWVVKLNSIGTIEWTKTLGGSAYDWAYDIQQTMDGGYIVAGYTRSNDGDVIGQHGSKDAWVVKLGNSGTLEWQKTLGGSSNDEAWSIELTSDGGYIMAGTSSSNDGDVTGNHGGSLDFWVVKLNMTGGIEWQKSLGGSYDDSATKIKQTIDGGYIVVGETESDDGDVSGNNGNVDFWVVKLSNTGDLEWQHALGGTGLDVGRDIHETNDGFIVCGYVGSNDGDVTGYQGLFDYWILKLGKNGTLMWQKTLGGSNADYARSLLQTSDGMYTVVGTTKSTNGDVEGNYGIEVVWVVKINDQGEIIWKKTMGGTEGDGGHSIQQTIDKGFIVAGYAWSNNGDVSGNHGKADFWVVKLSPETVGTNEAAPTTALEIFPNPAQQSISLKIPAEETDLSVSISDLLGREILRRSIAGKGEIDISSLASGSYLVVATGGSGQRYSGVLQKK